MTQLKRRLSILLCFLMVFTTVFVAAPTEAQAASESYSIYTDRVNNSNYTTNIYKGAKNFYAGDFIYAYKYISTSNTYVSEYLGYLSTISKGVEYKSSNTKVAKINKTTGLVDAVGTGTTTITVKYKGQKVEFDINVLSVSNFYKKINTDYSNYKNTAKLADKNANAFIKEFGKETKVTSKNRYDLLTAYKNYESYNGYTSLYKNGYDEDGNYYYTNDYYYYSPTAYHAEKLTRIITDYAEGLNPFSTWSSKYFKVSKISGKGKEIKVTLKSKVTADMIYGANYQFSWDSEVDKSKTYSFPIVVQNTKNNRKYYAIATVKEGSKTMTITLKNHKLKKGVKYQLLARTTTERYPDYLGNWLDEKSTFKAK